MCKMVCAGFLGLPWKALIYTSGWCKIYWRIVESIEETDRSGSYTCNYACDKKICNKRYIYTRNVRRREDVYLKRKKEYFMTMKIFVQLV